MIARHLHLRNPAFGRRRPFVMDSAVVPAPGLSDDLKLFALTYACGFVFVSVFLA